MRISRRRAVFAVLAVLFVGILAAPALMANGPDNDLAPDNPGLKGTKALAALLRHHGAQFEATTSFARATERATSTTTVLITRPDLLQPDDLIALSTQAGRTVLVQPNATTLIALDWPVSPSGSAEAEVRQPGCSWPPASAIGTATGGGLLYRAHSGSGLTSCYGKDGAASLVISPNAVVIGQPDILRNGHLAQLGNASLALHLIGTGPVLWYTPDPLDPALKPPGVPVSLMSQVPPVIWWTLAQVVLAAIVAMFWRGRRLGRPVAETLPVVIPSAEAVLGRGRLYESARARETAAAILRASAVRRIAARLHVPRSVSPDELVALLAARSGEPAAQVKQIFFGPAPDNEEDLMRLAGELDQWERRGTSFLTAGSPEYSAVSATYPERPVQKEK